jgi:hypothetical protein
MAEFSEYPHMIFVDGENFTIRGQEVAKAKKIDLFGRELGAGNVSVVPGG